MSRAIAKALARGIEAQHGDDQRFRDYGRPIARNGDTEAVDIHRGTRLPLPKAKRR
jgi:hypothetical protein